MNELILVVDDEEIIREALTEVLLDEGYRVVTAMDGAEALETAQREKPDLVVLDADIPKKNGFEVCMELKGPGLRELNQVPVMMITGVYKRPENNARALLRSKADDYVLKPFKREDFLHRVKVLLHRKKE
jgi:two-component system OmpR family response regulator/two-component system alkaline phosphatase synthesis response regulator PhoP